MHVTHFSTTDDTRIVSEYYLSLIAIVHEEKALFGR